MNPGLSAEEQAQIYQTIEMFEVITQSQRDDYQSLEILKEAYAKLGRGGEALRVSKQLVEAYYSHGQYSAALMECEGILQHEPDSPDVLAILGDLEGKLSLSSQAPPRTPRIGMEDPSAFQPAQAHLVPAPAGEEYGEPPRPTIPMPAYPAAPETRGAYLDGAYAGALATPGAPGAPGVNGRLMHSPEQSPDQGQITLDYSAVVTGTTAGVGADGGLVAQVGDTTKVKSVQFNLTDDGSEVLARQLVQLGMAPAESIRPILDQVVQHNRSLQGEQMAASLLVELSRTGLLTIEDLMSDFVTRGRLAYVPLECYDVDRQTIKMLPIELTLHRLILPFDIISRTLLVALSNPLDAAGKTAVQQSVDFHVHWYLASPEAIQSQLSQAYKTSVTLLNKALT